MKNFEVFKVDESMFEIIIVMKTYESPFEYTSEISRYLRKCAFTGYVAIDQMLHSGNSDERFILAFFDGEDFKKESFEFKNINRRSAVRKYICDMLRNEPEAIDLSTLSNLQKQLIIKGCFI